MTTSVGVLLGAIADVSDTARADLATITHRQAGITQYPRLATFLRCAGDVLAVPVGATVDLLLDAANTLTDAERLVLVQTFAAGARTGEPLSEAALAIAAIAVGQ